MENHHHILNPRQEWSLRPEGRRLRNNHLLIPELDVDVHKELHENCPTVPLLGLYALRAINCEPWEGKDTLTSVDNLLVVIHEMLKRPRFHPVDRELGELAIHAIDLQKPYIKEGLRSEQVYNQR